MKPSQKCKAAGLSGLAELVEITGMRYRTLLHWAKNAPEKFDGMVRLAEAYKATNRVESLTEALRDAYEAISKSDAAFARIIERSGLSDAHTLADLAEYVRLQADIIDVCQATIRAIETENKAFRGDENGFE